MAVPPGPTRHSRHSRGSKRRFSPMLLLRTLVTLVAVAVIAVTGIGWSAYRSVTTGFTQSDVLAEGNQPKSSGGDQNILIMGLDSRLDERGDPLPSAMYDALHAGDQDNGGYNANVLIMLHVPGDGSKATAISIPRDDYVNLVGCPDDQCKGKIKQAYGLAVAQAKTELESQGIKDPVTLEQKAREAGRKSEIATVRQFLGGVPIDHFVEVTLAAFFQIAEVVQPIKVCLNEDTSDSYSGANFHKGVQEINASQAVAFVRQRRDPNTDLNFTDLDRTRRQQAFIVSLAHQLQQRGTLTDVSQLQGILDVAKKNIAVDSGLNLVDFAKNSSNLTGGSTTFFTLPVDHFGMDPNGEDVNFVDLPSIHAIVRQLLGPPKGSSQSSTPGPSVAATPTPDATVTTIAGSSGVVLNVVNSSGRTGYAGRLEELLSARGFTQGSASTGSIRSSSVVEYGSGAAAPAQQLAKLLGGVTYESNSDLPADTVRLVAGTGLTIPTSLGGTASDNSGSDNSDGSSDSSDSTTPPTPVTAVSASGKGDNAPAPTNLSQMDGGGVPCVK